MFNSSAQALVSSVHDPHISRAELSARLLDPQLTVVNVMPNSTFDNGHIPKSINLPVADIDSQARGVMPDLAREIAIYCAGPTCPLALEAVRLLHSQGYTKVRHYIGGMADWLESGGAMETSAGSHPETSTAGNSSPIVARSHGWAKWLVRIADWPMERLVGFWLGMILAFGVVFWGAGFGMGWGLQAGATAVKTDFDGFATAIYFSFVTALSVGYGDVIPLGPMRIIAVLEGIAGLLIFGCVISKLVSKRQEELTEDIHRTTFEDRLDRVRTNLHLVFSDFGSVQQQLQAEQGALPHLVLRRLESTVRVFRGELQTIHDLLYRCKAMPDEDVLESLLANLTICLEAFVDIRKSIKDVGRSPSLDSGLQAVSKLAREICGECVPRAFAPALRESMDQVQALAQRLV